MSETRHETVHRLFTEAIRLAADERPTFLDEACDDADLRSEVEAMLAEDARNGGTLDVAVDAGGARFLANALAESGEIEPDAPDHPERLGKYTILRRIGEGGMGVVYEAEQEDPKRRVALKVIRTSIVTRGLLQRFRHEARVLGHLRHPGIAQIYEAGTADTGAGGQPYFAMELVEGETITDYAENHAVDTNARLALLAQLCDILEYAHQKGVIHRDIKPANVLVIPNLVGSGSTASGSAQLKVLDFGVARATDADLNTVTLQTAMGQLVGTVPYMSPEQASGDPAELDTRSDVYSVAVLGWELLTGRLPYDVKGKMVHEVVRVIREEEASRLSVIDRSLRGDVETIFAKALEKEKDRRYQSSADLADDLRRHLAHEPIAARPASTAYQLRKFARRNKTLVGGVLATLLVAITGAIIATKFAVDATREAALQRRATYQATLAAAASAIDRGDFIGADGYLDRLPAELTGWEHAHLRARLSSSAERWPAPAQVMTAPVFDAEGEHLYAVMDDMTLGTWSVAKGRLIDARPLDMHRVAISQAVIHGPTRRMAFVSSGGEIEIIALDGVEQARVETGREAKVIVVQSWDDAGGRLLWSHSRIPVPDHPGRHRAELMLWDGTRSRVIDADWIDGGFVGVMTKAVFNHRGDRIAVVGSWHGRAYCWLLDATTGSLVERMVLDDTPLSVAFAPDDERLAIAFTYHDVYVLDAHSLEVTARPSGHRDLVQWLAWTGDRRLVTTSKDGTVRIRTVDSAGASIVQAASLELDTRTAAEAISTEYGYDLLGSVSPDDRHAAVACRDIQLFPLDEPGVLRGHGTYVYSLAFSPDGSRLVSGGFREPEIHVWDVDTGRPLARFRAPRFAAGLAGLWGRAPALAFSDDGRRLVAGTTSDTVHHDVETGAELAASEGDEYTARFLETLGTRRTVRLLDPSVAMSADGARVAICEEDGAVRVHATGRSLREWVPAEAYAPALDGLIAPEPDHVLEGHVGRAWCAAFSPDGARIATGGKDQTVRIWDARTGDQLLVLRGHTAYVKDVLFSPDGTVLASASGDFTVRLWDTLPLHERRARGRPPDEAAD